MECSISVPHIKTASPSNPPKHPQLHSGKLKIVRERNITYCMEHSKITFLDQSMHTFQMQPWLRWPFNDT